MEFLTFGVIPVLTVAIIFIVKRKILWTAPLISTALAFITYTIALAPVSITEVFSDNEWQGFFILALLIHLGIAVILTVIAYFVAYLMKQKQE